MSANGSAEVESLARIGAVLIARISQAIEAAETTPPQRRALTKAEAADSLGVSVDFFEAHVQPELRLVRKGRKVLIPVGELDRWLSDNAATTLPTQRGAP